MARRVATGRKPAGGVSGDRRPRCLERVVRTAARPLARPTKRAFAIRSVLGSALSDETSRGGAACKDAGTYRPLPTSTYANALDAKKQWMRWRRLNGFERAVRTCFAYFRQRLSQRFHARSRWRECEAGDGLRRTTISGEEEKGWRSGRELRRNADIVART